MNNLTIGSHYPATILHHLKEDEPAYRATLERFGLSRAMLSDPRVRISMECYIPLYRHVTHLLGDESFGYLEHPLQPGTLSVGCDYAANAETIGDALNRLCRFFTVVTVDVTLTLHPAGGRRVAFEVALRDPGRDAFHFVTELFLCIAFRFASWMAGQAVTLHRARFAYDPPPHAMEYMFLFPCEHVFEAGGANALEFDSTFLSLPVLKSAKDVKSYIERLPEDLLTAIMSDDSFSNRVYMALNTTGDHGPQIFQQIASDLAMSEQTLRRKLRAEGGNFQSIKDRLRRETAIFHLRAGKYTVTEISERLGFSTPSAFSRAFKSWTGQSPKEFRDG